MKNLHAFNEFQLYKDKLIKGSFKSRQKSPKNTKSKKSHSSVNSKKIKFIKNMGKESTKRLKLKGTLLIPSDTGLLSARSIIKKDQIYKSFRSIEKKKICKSKKNLKHPTKKLNI
mmetsp:Transcript_24199/g.21501  ORF Transcript_24199/g.21501 Transcript_24199/m.21501 type:complete len:115 (+) Transcript_24199:249-593(+)